MKLVSQINLVHLTSSLKMGGAERVLFEIVTSLDPSKYKQVVLYFHGGPYVQLLRDQGITIIQIKGWLFRYDPVFWFRLFRTIYRIKPDAMHTLLWMANVAGRVIGRILKIPTFCVVHNNVTQDGKVRSFIDHLILAKSDNIIAVSEEVRDSLCARHSWLPSQRVTVIPNGVNVQTFAQAAAAVRKERPDFGYADDQILIGTVGRFVPLKQYDLLLRSFAELHKYYPQTRLMLVGTGPQEQQLRDLSITLEINSVVTFIINEPAIFYYGLFDCFTMSSAQEGISLALLEAMSSSLACVVTNSKAPDHTVLTNLYDGLVVESNNTKALTEGLIQVVANAELRQNLGAMAYRTVVKRFQKNRMIRQYDHLFYFARKP